MIKAEILEYIRQIKGIEIVIKHGRELIEIADDFSLQELPILLKIFKDNNIEFGIYDELYPSMSDSGGYLGYSQEKVTATDNWSMTVGNHGWSGGIYRLRMRPF